MALRRNPSHTNVSGHSKAQKLEGTVRRAQLISTYGVGSMIAVGDRSFIVSGLDTWCISQAQAVYEPNLQHWLGVDKFVLPPADPDASDGVRVRLFPEMYSCPGCHVLQPFSKFGSSARKGECALCRKPLTPSRFVLACRNGHLDEFPYWEWVHHKTDKVGWSGGKTKHELELRTEGNSASLRSIVISCSCGAEPVSMQGAFGQAAMKDLNVRCRGRRPWLGKDAPEEQCSEVPRTLQRGSSAAWFPIQRSALSIPPWSSAIQKLVDKYADQLAMFTDERGRAAVASTMTVGSGFSADQIIAAIEERQRLAQDDGEEGGLVLDAGTRIRQKEYLQLTHGTHGEEDGDFVCEPPAAAVDPVPCGLEKVMLVKRLREVRALQSFTRVDMPDPAQPSSRRARLSIDDVRWLPAVEVNGEGVFMTLEGRRLKAWEAEAAPQRRAEQIRANHTRLLRSQSTEAAGTMPESPMTARFLLLHTLSHALINELSLDCGYPAASLRERVYCSDDMAGILIYTASSDSAGSLGGVVAQGELYRLQASLFGALERVSWCSQDPPCMESEAAGTDNLNLAACYACVLLPETSCETNNSFLDRALLVGTPDSPEAGYFADALM